jgi:hypothetical protein
MVGVRVRVRVSRVKVRIRVRLEKTKYIAFFKSLKWKLQTLTVTTRE